MTWENLQKNKCPYCSAKLDVANLRNEICCTECFFHINVVRFESIVEHRGRSEGRQIVRMKWQNVHKDKCPVCSFNLMKEVVHYDILKCVNESCSFRIRYDRLQTILDDTTHPANRFKGVV